MKKARKAVLNSTEQATTYFLPDNSLVVIMFSQQYLNLYKDNNEKLLSKIVEKSETSILEITGTVINLKGNIVGYVEQLDPKKTKEKLCTARDILINRIKTGEVTATIPDDEILKYTLNTTFFKTTISNQIPKKRVKAPMLKK